jgi:hypothetical protein
MKYLSLSARSRMEARSGKRAGGIGNWMKNTLMKSDINTAAAIYMRINSTTRYLYESPQISVKADSSPVHSIPAQSSLGILKTVPSQVWGRLRANSNLTSPEQALTQP